MNRWGVLPGKRTAIFTNNDDGWATAKSLSDRGLEVTAVIDSRKCDPVENIPGASIIMGGKIVKDKQVFYTGRYVVAELL